MTALEVMIWSMACGAIGVVVAAGFADWAMSRSTAALQGVAYHLAAFLFVFLLSGLAQAGNPGLAPGPLFAAQVLSGPAVSTMGNWWIRGWLSAHQRDRVMAGSLKLSAALTPLAGMGCLWLPPSQQLPAAAAICLFNSGLVVWLAVRAWLLGDRLALGMAAGCLLLLPSIAGLYAIAMKLPGIGLATQAVLALCAAACACVIGAMLWQRNRHERRARREGTPASQLDPVTQLFSGVALVQKLIKAQRRRRRTRRDGAVLAVMLFDTDRIVSQAGQAGLNEVFIHLATRIQRQVGVVNPVGRYYDRCFVTLVETIHSPGWLRTLGLRVASSLRRPMEVTSPDGRRLEVRADIGVGVVHLSRAHADVEDILHDAQRMAEAARRMRSRAAILDPATGDVVPVEEANLGPRRHGVPAQVPHVMRPVQRARG